MEQSDGGDWNFAIVPTKLAKTSPDGRDDYSRCLRSPFLHGPTTSDLLAWRFGQDAEPGYAQRVPVTEDVSFTTNAADQRYECAETDAMYKAYEEAQSAGRDEDYNGGLPHYKRRPLGEARVIVKAVRLKPGLSEPDAEFESVTLWVTVRFPKKRYEGR